MGLWNFAYWSMEDSEKVYFEKDTTEEQFKKDCIAAYREACRKKIESGGIYRTNHKELHLETVGDLYDGAVTELIAMGYRMLESEGAFVPFGWGSVLEDDWIGGAHLEERKDHILAIREALKDMRDEPMTFKDMEEAAEHWRKEEEE